MLCLMHFTARQKERELALLESGRKAWEAGKWQTAFSFSSVIQYEARPALVCTGNIKTHKTQSLSLRS